MGSRKRDETVKPRTIECKYRGLGTVADAKRRELSAAVQAALDEQREGIAAAILERVALEGERK